MIAIPFSGGKRYCYKEVRAIVEENGYTAIREPFGGSCVLSVNLANDGLVDDVVANDYDGIFEIYPEYLRIRERIVNALYAAGYVRLKRRELSKRGNRTLSPEHKAMLREMVSRVDEKYWRLLSHDFCMTSRAAGNRIDIKQFGYCNWPKDLSGGWEYLEALKKVTLTSCDWRGFYRDVDFPEGTLIILDPPYPGTSQVQYGGGFDDMEGLLDETLKLGRDFILFGKDRGSLEPLLESRGVDADWRTVGVRTACANFNRRDCMVHARVAQ